MWLGFLNQCLHCRDWLENDRADRVVIISADNVTEIPFGMDCLVSLQAVQHPLRQVEEAALPFDARRRSCFGHGCSIICHRKKFRGTSRGVQPYAEILGTKLANSAFHGTRLMLNTLLQPLMDLFRNRRQVGTRQA